MHTFRLIQKNAKSFRPEGEESSKAPVLSPSHLWEPWLQQTLERWDSSGKNNSTGRGLGGGAQTRRHCRRPMSVDVALASPALQQQGQGLSLPKL